MKSSIFLAACLVTFVVPVLPARSADQHDLARPGTINYVEGQVTLGSQPVTPASTGQVSVDPGQTLATQDGKAEVLLTPGAFFRLGPTGVVRMISSNPTAVAVSLEHGEAFVEVTEVHAETNLRVLEDGVPTEFAKAGLYNFNADLHIVRVLDGEARIFDGNRSIKVVSGHMVVLNGSESFRVKSSTSRKSRRRIYIAGPAFVLPISPKPMRTMPQPIPTGDSAGSATVGIGIPGLASTLSFPPMASSTVPLGGASIPPGASSARPSSGALTTTIISVQLQALPGDPRRIIVLPRTSVAVFIIPLITARVVSSVVRNSAVMAVFTGLGDFMVWVVASTVEVATSSEVAAASCA